MNEVESKVLAAVKANPLASQSDLAKSLEMSRESVAGHIMRLTRKGAILGKGYILPTQGNIVVLGGANVDLSGTSSNTYLPADSNPGVVEQSAGGVGRNIAENLARLGNETALISMIGKDSRGRYLLDQARQANINMQDCIQHPTLATSSYLALNNHKGELVGAVADMSIVDELLPQLLTEKLPRLHGASILVIEANLPAETIEWLAATQIKAPIAADAVSVSKARRLAPLLSQLDLLKVNKQEALTLLGLSDDANVTEQDVISELLNLGVSRVLLSLGERGVTYGSANEIISLSGPSCKMRSDTGAGDALLAGFIHADKLFQNNADKLRFALACAASALEAKHAVNESLSEAALFERFDSYLEMTNLNAQPTE